MPHVCMVVHSRYPVGEPRVEREARAAAAAGYDVHVVCLGSAGEPPGETRDQVRVVRIPIEHVRGAGGRRMLSEYGGFTLAAAAKVARLHRQFRFDAVYVHAPPDFLILSALFPRLFGAGVVLDIHDLSPDMFEARFGGSPLAGGAERVLRSVELRACGLAHRVVTVHDQYRDELVKHGVPRQKISVVMNAPDENVLDRAKEARSDRERSESFVVAYHGTINEWYGVDLVVEALAALDSSVPNLRAIVLGEGDALPTVEGIARRSGLEDRIEFSRRYVPHAEALTRIAIADCGVIPNRASRLNRFALSSKLLEYVEIGIPVVVARLETLAAHFSSDEVTFFDPGAKDSLAEAIAWVAQHPDEAHAKAERARRRAEAYSWSESSARLLGVLAEVTTRRARRPD